jgi:hypothetical protein
MLPKIKERLSFYNISVERKDNKILVTIPKETDKLEVIWIIDRIIGITFTEPIVFFMTKENLETGNIEIYLKEN